MAAGKIVADLLFEQQAVVRLRYGQEAPHELAIGFAPCHAISHLAPVVSLRPQEPRECGSCYFFVIFRK